MLDAGVDLRDVQIAARHADPRTTWLTWCTTKARWPAPALPGTCERRAEPCDETRAVDRASIEAICARRDIPLRERVLWQMLYETASRASAVLALNVEDCDFHNRRARVTVKGRHTEWIAWGRGTALLLPRYLRGRSRGPLFLADRAPGPHPDQTPHRHAPAHPAQFRRHPPRRGRRRRHRDHGQGPLALHPHRRPLHPHGLAAITTATDLLDPSRRRA